MARGIMEPYHPEPYWSRVAQEIKLRTRHGQVAGDDAPYYRYKREKFLSRFLGSLDVEGRITLEVGCGPGGNLLQLTRRGPKQLIGVDISPVMLEVAAETVRDSRQPVELRQIDGTRLPFPDGSIDLTLTVTVLQHNTDPSMFARLVGDICRVTRDMVVLVEDVGTETSTIDPGCSWILRPVTAYEAECRRHGFRLVGAASLNTAVSRRAHHAFARRLLRHDHREGEPLPATARLVMSTALLFTRLLDDAYPEKRDLTKMTFTRTAQYPR